MANVAQILEELRDPSKKKVEVEETPEARELRLWWDTLRNSREVQQFLNFLDKEMQARFLRAGLTAVDGPLNDPRVKDTLLLEAGVLLKVISSVKLGKY